MKHPLLRRLPPVVDHYPSEIYHVRDAINMHTEVLEQIIDRLNALDGGVFDEPTKTSIGDDDELAE